MENKDLNEVSYYFENFVRGITLIESIERKAKELKKLIELFNKCSVEKYEFKLTLLLNGKSYRIVSTIPYKEIDYNEDNND